ncbi:MAG: DUF1722 domain-containing protein [Desulfobacca sp.]|nr:DUF1722 domain-containing protein [Desulfobacca sp.]
METKILLGISACLLGDKVRYDGGHKADHFIIDTLGNYVDFVPVCPEVECGLGIPREAMRLVGDRENPRLITFRTRVDYTERMIQWARGRIGELKKMDLCGFIFKSDSPSSGLERVKVYNDQGIPAKNGVGLFAREFLAHFPLLPLEEEGRLHDPGLRENFIERIFALKRWRDMLASKPRLKDLVEFHTRHKFLILSHSRKHYQKMGTLVAQSESMTIADRCASYQVLFLEALSIKTTPKKNTDVLLHIMGFFKKDLSADEKQELLGLIDYYKKGLIPLIVPITLMRHYVRKYGQPYLKNQVYLDPHPLELKLRNHV